MKLPLITAQITPPPLVGSFRPTRNSLRLIIFREHRSMKFDFFLLEMLEIILILTGYHWKKALIQWFNIKTFSICCSNTISAFFPINVLISPKDIIWTVEWSAIKICSSRRMSFSNRNLLWAVCTPFYQIRQSNNLNLSPNDQYEEQKMFFHPFLELGMSRCTVERGRSKSRQLERWDISKRGHLLKREVWENCLGRQSGYDSLQALTLKLNMPQPDTPRNYSLG